MDAADAHSLLACPRSRYFCSLCAACGGPFCQRQMRSQPHCSAVETACLSPDRFASLWLCCAMLGCCAVALTCVCVCFVLALPGAPVVKIRQMPFGARRKKKGTTWRSADGAATFPPTSAGQPGGIDWRIPGKGDKSHPIRLVRVRLPASVRGVSASYGRS